MTGRQMVAAALQDLGILAAGREPSGSDLSLGVRHLNWMLKEWQADGANLWRQEDVDVPWLAGTVEGAVTGVDGRSLNDIISLRYAPTAGNERLLERWELDHYSMLPNKLTLGAPSIYSVVRGVDYPRSSCGRFRARTPRSSPSSPARSMILPMNRRP
jgi:hypothetical protein